MPTKKEILSRLRTALTLEDPEWDVSIGTPEYKILEAVSQEIKKVYHNDTLHDYHFDIERKSGEELDDFVELFGIERSGGKRATGEVTFKRGQNADRDYTIPTGVQVLKPTTGENPSVYFQTTTSATLEEGTTQVSVPVEAVSAGKSGNVQTGDITELASSVDGITEVTNDSPTSGGKNVESDRDLRKRWKKTKFKHAAGKQDYFLSLALEHDEVSNAIVFGAANKVRESLQFDDDEAKSTVVDAKHVFEAGSEFIGFDLNTASETLGIRDTDYTFDNSVPAKFTLIDNGKFENGDVVEVEYEYTPKASRNDPENSIAHKIDLFVQGRKVVRVTEDIKFDSSKFLEFDSSNRQDFKRKDEETHPAEGNVFIPLSRTPLISVPDRISIGDTEYDKGEDFWLVRDVTLNQNSYRARDGLEWYSDNLPEDGKTFIVQYDYNRLITDLQEEINRLKLIGFDVLVHHAHEVWLKFNIAVVFEDDVPVDNSIDDIADQISEWLAEKDFRGVVRVGDMIRAVLRLEGVRNVRLIRESEDDEEYGIEHIAEDGSTLDHYTSDIFLESNQLPVLYEVNVTTKGKNTFDA